MEAPAEAETWSTIGWTRPWSGRKAVDRYRIMRANLHLACGPVQLYHPIARRVDACASCSDEGMHEDLVLPNARLRVSGRYRVAQSFKRKSAQAIIQPVNVKSTMMYGSGTTIQQPAQSGLGRSIDRSRGRVVVHAAGGADPSQR